MSDLASRLRVLLFHRCRPVGPNKTIVLQLLSIVNASIASDSWMPDTRENSTGKKELHFLIFSFYLRDGADSSGRGRVFR